MIDTYTLLDVERLNKKAGIRSFDERVFGPIDPDRERWEASRTRFVTSKGHVIKVPTIRGAGTTAPVPSDLWYVNKTSYTSKNTFTTEAQINDTTTNPLPVMPVNFFDPSYGERKVLRITARGQILTTTTGPTFTILLRLDSLTGLLALQAGPSTGSTISLVATSVASGFELECDIVLRTYGTGTTGVFQAEGQWSSPGLSPTLIAAWGNNVPPGTISTLAAAGTDVQHTLWVDAACGTSNAANGITLLQLFGQALN